MAREQEEQRRWRVRRALAGWGIFNHLVANEFLSADEQRWRQLQALKAVLQHASKQVPYYRRLFKERGLRLSDFRRIDDLGQLPVLTRRDIQESGGALQAEALPPGERTVGQTRTSGSTGEPVVVLQTTTSRGLFGILRQREDRWFRWDPNGTYASIYSSAGIPTRGKSLEEGVTISHSSWPYVGPYFETGPYYAFLYTNPIEEQIAWLSKHPPHYLTSLTSNLEQLALAYQGRQAPERLQGILAAGIDLTPEVRRRLERAFHVPIEQNYGLNEIGMVAGRCPEGGRYHVHAEHCLVEIVDEQGQPCGPGERGRVLVTALRNPAMPLLRYDTGDLAEVAGGPCPCGRTLPSFGHIHGRYRLIATLPPGTMDYFRATLSVIEEMPVELGRDLRQYQLHQYEDGHFELRLAAVAALPQALHQRIREGWNAVRQGGTPPPLAIREVARIPPPPGGKHQIFTSDFMPPPDRGGDGG